MTKEYRVMEAYKSIGKLVEKAKTYSFDTFDVYETLPDNHRNTCYVRATIASTYFHIQNFVMVFIKIDQAQKHFDWVIDEDPSFYMDECSSNLWQLKHKERLRCLFENLFKNCPLSFQVYKKLDHIPEAFRCLSMVVQNQSMNKAAVEEANLLLCNMRSNSEYLYEQDKEFEMGLDKQPKYFKQ
ncbi:hypothetical protein RF11_04216 [Thelohanellus kitauei]|uniref:Uncharacterized protein n=1 Tax=Thelohanellus kitauei TaxID=669202 RepID=A0A0C2MPF9_THEKT|nr:hypothetical protein RF11_04216 [Thelohanellus kitauei]